MRLDTAHFVPYEYLELEPEGSTISVVPSILANNPLRLDLHDDGQITYEFEFIGEQKSPHVERVRHSQEFAIYLPERLNVPHPLICSDGRFVIIRLPDGPIFHVYTYEDGRGWLRWIPRTTPPGYPAIVASGYRNYRHMGTAPHKRAIVATAILAIITIFLLLVEDY